MKSNARHGQRGVTLIVGMIMLILITLMVTTAFTLNTSNLKSVGNMQFRNESIAAANKAIEQIVGTQFSSTMTSVPPGGTVTYDINNDGTTDYTVSVAVPTCMESSPIVVGGSGSCSGSRAGALAGCTKSNYSTLWDVQASVKDSLSGAAVTVKQGVRLELSSSQRDTVCPAT